MYKQKYRITKVRRLREHKEDYINLIEKLKRVKTEDDLRILFDSYSYLREHFSSYSNTLTKLNLPNSPMHIGNNLAIKIADKELNEDVKWTKTMYVKRKSIKMTESIIKKNLRSRVLLEDDANQKLVLEDWYTPEIQKIVTKAISHSISVMASSPNLYHGLEQSFNGKKEQLLGDAYIVWVEKVLPKELTWQDQGLVYSIIEKYIRKPYWNAAQRSRRNTPEQQTNKSGEVFSLYDKIPAMDEAEKIRLELDSYGLGKQERELAILKAYFQGGISAVTKEEMKDIIDSLPHPEELDRDKVTNNHLAKAMGFKSQADAKFYRIWNNVKRAMA